MKEEYKCDIDYKLPPTFELAPWSFGFCILGEGPQFVPWHSDWEDAADSFITLHGQASKLWILLPPGKFAAEVERLAREVPALIDQLPELVDQAYIAVQAPGETLYLPYGWHHTVSTFGVQNQFTCLLSISTLISEERKKTAWAGVTQGALGVRRNQQRQKGPINS